MQGQSSYWRENSRAPLCIPSLLSNLILPKLGLHMDTLLMEHQMQLKACCYAKKCVGHIANADSIAITPISTVGNSVPDLSWIYIHLAIPLVECLTWKANCIAFSRLCRDAHLACQLLPAALPTCFITPSL